MTYLDQDQDEENENHLRVADKVEEFLTDCFNLHDYIEETELISSKINIILNDIDDDKLGRIRDFIVEIIKTFALWVEENYTTNKHAIFVYNEMLKTRE